MKQAGGGDLATVPVSPGQRVIAQSVVMAAAALIVLDQTIATVALPHMQAALGATPDTISWVLTSYILATAVAIPMTAWLTGKFGRRMLFCAAVLIFTLSSAACAFATSLPMMVIARAVQGYSGAFLIPLSQSFMLDINPPSRHLRALTLWGLGIMVAPILGPVLGGYLTAIMDWRWIFLINVPIGLVVFICSVLALPECPDVDRPFDGRGFILVLVALCCLQLMLDRGTQQDWFDSTEIIIEAGVCVGAFWLLVFHLLRARHPIVAVELFRDRNFAAALVIGLVINPITGTSAAIMPQFMQVLLQYPVLTAGLLIIPRGIGVTVAMMAGPRLLARYDSRAVLLGGLVMVVLSMFIQTRFSLQMDMSPLVWSGFAQGIGVGIAVATSNMMSMANLPVHLRTEGAALYMLARSIGTSILISITSALLAYNLQVNHEEVGSSLQLGMMRQLTKSLAGEGAAPMVARLIDAEVNRQALMIAYLDVFWLMTWMTVAVMPILLFLKRVRPSREPVMMAE